MFINISGHYNMKQSGQPLCLPWGFIYNSPMFWFIRTDMLNRSPPARNHIRGKIERFFNLTIKENLEEGEDHVKPGT